MTYAFSVTVPVPDDLTYAEAVHRAHDLLASIPDGTRIRDVMPWTHGEDLTAILVHAYPLTQDIQPQLAEWLNAGVIYAYTIERAPSPAER